MSELSKKYSDIIKEIDEKIENEQDRQFMKDKLSEVSVIFIDLIDKMGDILEERISNIEKSQKNMEKKLSGVQDVMDSIEQEMYDENQEIEITCPYCNNDFLADFNENEVADIECPECHNIIELDVNADYDEDNGYTNSGCSGSCGRCGNCHEQKNNDDEK